MILAYEEMDVAPALRLGAFRRRLSSARALPASHGLGMMKQPEACRLWNVLARSSRAAILVTPSVKCGLEVAAFAPRLPLGADGDPYPCMLSVGSRR